MEATKGSKTLCPSASIPFAAKGMPSASVTIWCLLPALLPSVGFELVWSPKTTHTEAEAITARRDQSTLSASRK